MPPTLLAPPTQQPQTITLHGVTWEQYDTLVELFIDQFPALRMTYLEGTLEIMTTSPEHERIKTIIGRLIEAFAEEFDLDLNGYGAATFRKQIAERALEPDECYCFGPFQDVPDIAVEVVITSGTLKKLQVYQGLGVQEVWFWQQGNFEIYALLDGDRGYEAQPSSPLLPNLDFALLAQFVDNPQQTQAVKAYRRALQESLNIERLNAENRDRPPQPNPMQP
ncbi:Uma2 family endonuclease [Prochlorothrix hollandica]|uniref:Uma2 family endonuclease n=1 Tax=Prochlorothrix hollandica TaxID=1223 RepID=UPI00034733C7|nr:Uma2 family endonuclease [Prochlorothrix hollandica]